MALLHDLFADHGVRVPPGVVEHLELLVAEWQVLADLSFADLLLFVPFARDDGTAAYLCAGQIRPYTAQTIYQEDLVGQAVPVTDRPMVGRALAERRIIRDTDPEWSTGVPVREEAVPVRYGDDVVAVVTREANVSAARAPSNLELTYLRSAGDLSQMLAEGTFPQPPPPGFEERGLSPRVGDGIIRVDAGGRVTYASPNSISAYRRLGSLDSVQGQHLTDFEPYADEFVAALEAAEPLLHEVERQGAVVLRRLLPLCRGQEVIGGLLLVREITDLRRHERALRVKDATIREIHHRVKNNLQTVASLLRLQARRLSSEEARAALAESVRRITSIALVHETLSQESRQKVRFDRVAERIVDMLADGLTDTERPVTFAVEGSPGELPAQVATPLALVLTELVQNCVEHAFVGSSSPGAGDPVGHVWVRFERDPSTLRVAVVDDGRGLPDAVREGAANLGLQIVRTLVESELGGSFTARGRDPRGTVFELSVPGAACGARPR